MFYGTNENGEIVQSESSDVVDGLLQDYISEDASDMEDGIRDYPGLDSSSDSDFLESSEEIGNYNIFINTESDSGDIVITDSESGPQIILPSTQVNPIDYDELIEAYASIPSYTVYPSTAAVDVLSAVLNGLDRNVGYVLVSGADTYTTLLYYSDEYTVSGSTITLLSPVTCCKYYYYRPSSTSTYIYTYTVSSLSDCTFTLSNQLAYTNLLDGYPDLIPYKSHESYTLMILLSIAALVCCVLSFSSRFSKKTGR